MVQFFVEQGDVIEVASDLLLLKHAQDFYGADQAVAAKLVSAKLCTEMEIRPAPGEFVVLETRGVIAPKRVMFLGTPPLRSFNYSEMHLFAFRAIEKIADLRLPIRTITTTVHGTGYGLDGGESLLRLARGFKGGLSEHTATQIETITFLTLGERDRRMMRYVLGAMELSEKEAAGAQTSDRMGTKVHGAKEIYPSLSVKDAAVPSFAAPTGTSVVSKKRVFVAMPFSEEFENVFEFGIYPAVRNCGFICEKVDQTHFAGDILARIREGIEAASLVIADLTEGRPNVYLEVGYAWGRGVPVVFVARKGQQLHFDVSTHRCIYYGKFTQLSKDLEELIRGIEASRGE